MGILPRKNRAMKIPTEQIDRFTFRLPASLLEELRAVAAVHGHSVNAEILARVEAAPIHDQLAAQARDIAELKRMVKELLEK